MKYRDDPKHIANILSSFRGKYEKLTNINAMNLILAKNCCCDILNKLQRENCKNFTQVTNCIRKEAWKICTRDLVSGALQVSENDIEEIYNTLRNIYDLASGGFTVKLRI
ncbi:hypothetical protein [Acidianus sp. HS-5]|uniref:hypothetical protein n=1 Tax=Acidianus sp. HS-5 TaxID=2886040 RepID=UPI001F23B54A|nr:hypothetical protein [Acidianus sp. HS-5]BDC18778.1 hypothetical protein HS5_16680 [Acidianus sp. HS-5]